MKATRALAVAREGGMEVHLYLEDGTIVHLSAEDARQVGAVALMGPQASVKLGRRVNLSLVGQGRHGNTG